ncbi:MAG: helicase-related protein, partial [Pseudomonadota bacterium]
EKRNCLRALIDAEGEKLTNAIIFCNRKRDVAIVHKSLEKHGYNVGSLHGDLDQSVRMATLDAFRNDQIRLLVASDVAARGLDIPTVSHVFNFDVPTHSEDYVHRIGRTGRAGRDGTAITIGLPYEAKYLGFIEELIKTEIPRAATPEGIAVQPRDRRERPERAERETEAPAKPRARRERDAVPPKSEASRGRGRSRHQDDSKVVGMGDHVPAFLMRPTRPASPAPQEADAASAAVTESDTQDAA